jgi:polar amino acid transport system permease protein
MYVWHFEFILQYSDALIRGFVTTAELSLLSMLIALVLGTLLGVARIYSPSEWIRKTLAGLIEVLRAMPKVVVIVWMFYAFPVLSGINLPAFETAVAAISIVSAAFVAEIVRAGIESIPKGQIEAAQTLGMSKLQIVQSIVLPQAFMRNAPAFMGEFTVNIKDSAFAMIIGVGELMNITSGVALLSYRPLELYSVLGLLFLLLIMPLSMLSKRLEFRNIMNNKR